MSYKPPPAPPRPPPREVASIDDPDFGRMRLIYELSYGIGPGEEDWHLLEMYTWEGALSGLKFQIIVDEGGAFPDVPASTRAHLVRLAREESVIRREVATRELELARHWADSAELSEPTAESFFAAIRAASIDTYTDWRPTMWLEEVEQDEERQIFAGHIIMVRFNADGEIAEIGLAG